MGAGNVRQIQGMMDHRGWVQKNGCRGKMQGIETEDWM